MRKPEQVKSRTLRIANAYVTIHEHSAGTAILNVTLRTGQTGGHVAVWIDDIADVEALVQLLREWLHDKENRS
jgi:hypothetical protein